MKQIIPNVSNETDKLEVVVLGLPDSLGGVPQLSETYDAKSYEAISKGIFPSEQDVINEMNALHQTLLNNDVKVLRPNLLQDYNQVFARDVAFTIDDTLFVANLIPDRAKETNAMQDIFDLIAPQHIEQVPDKVHTEGGDVILYDDMLFIGCYLKPDYPTFKTARTNQYAIDYFKERFPNKTIIPLQLRKHDQDPRQSVLHLDCAFQPVGKGKALIYREGFLDGQELGLVDEIFGSDNLFAVTAEEAYYMNTNIVSLSPNKLISDKSFVRLNQHLRQNWDIAVDEVPYQEISKMGGLLRCSTMPLVRSAK